MWLVVVKFICAVIAIYATTLYISSVLTSISFNFGLVADDTRAEDEKRAKFRLAVGIIMAVCWSVLIVF